MAEISSRLVCTGCGWQPPAGDPAPFRCAKAGDGGDHVLHRRLSADAAGAAVLRRAFADSEPNPFLRFRRLLHGYRAAVERGWSDAELVASIEQLDRAVAAVDGRGFRDTPFVSCAGLAAALGVREVGVKDETGNVSGTHKARHLFGLMLWLRWCGAGTDAAPLAVASCGNAALGAAVVARAAGRPLDVFVPPWADARVVARLDALGSRLVTCERRPGEAGDPCYLRFREAVAAGALPFTCQGNENGLVLDGGKTLAWEMASSLSRDGGGLDRLFVQVGGGALASATIEGLAEAVRIGVLDHLPRIHSVQAEGVQPLARAWKRVVERILGEAGDAASTPAACAEAVGCVPAERISEALEHAAIHRSEYMWPWETEPRSCATGIADDETHDWLAVVEGMLETGGYPVVVPEETLREANRLGRAETGIAVDSTGTAGLAGALRLARSGELDGEERIAVLFTGRDRAAEVAGEKSL